MNGAEATLIDSRIPCMKGRPYFFYVAININAPTNVWRLLQACRYNARACLANSSAFIHKLTPRKRRTNQQQKTERKPASFGVLFGERPRNIRRSPSHYPRLSAPLGRSLQSPPRTWVSCLPCSRSYSRGWPERAGCIRLKAGGRCGLPIQKVEAAGTRHPGRRTVERTPCWPFWALGNRPRWRGGGKAASNRSTYLVLFELAGILDILRYFPTSSTRARSVKIAQTKYALLHYPRQVNIAYGVYLLKLIIPYVIKSRGRLSWCWVGLFFLFVFFFQP